MAPFQQPRLEPGRYSQREPAGEWSSVFPDGPRPGPKGRRLRFWFLFANSGAREYSVNKHLCIELLLCAQHCEGHKEALICETTDQNLSMQRSSLPREVGLLTGRGRLALFEELLPAPSPNGLDFSPWRWLMF